MLPKLMIGALPLIRMNGAGAEREGDTGDKGTGARDTTRALMRLLPLKNICDIFIIADIRSRYFIYI